VINSSAAQSASQAADFKTQLSQWQARSETELANRLPPASAVPQRLHQAMRYSVLGGGKRVRPVLMYATGTALELPLSQLDAAACAIELIHAYSLIHDDLPAMDDDDLRRGRPTCHKAFDEATAILAGDALQVLAFQLLASDPSLPADPAIRLRLVELLAIASGTDGMAGGQALDLAAEGQTLDLPAVELIHARKTGALIRAAVLMAGACKTPLDEPLAAGLDGYATAIGLAFQIQDDLLDIEGDPALLGKATGADQVHHKPTYPAVAGLAAAKARVQQLHTDALQALAPLGAAAEPLVRVANWLLLRQQ
jgi:geranylgeranyl pyrophosphate synthase